MSKILVTGAKGFIGKRLISALLSQGHTVYGLCRIRGTKIGSLSHENLHIVYGDLEDPEKMDPWPEDLDAAYYLVHSMAKKLKNLREIEEQAAKNFVHSIDRTRCRQIIYLSGIIQPEVELSAHLLSRKNVEKTLKTAKTQVTVLRASIIIGSGSASFEIIRDLVEKLPVMVAPRWISSLSQPIAISDVIYYLTTSLLNPAVYGNTFDIGGPEIISFKEIMLRYAKFRGLRRLIFEIPLLTPRLSSYWLVFVTSVRFSLCSYLVESMKYNSICYDAKIQQLLPHSNLKFEEALERAFSTIAKNQIASTWMDAWQVDQISPDISAFSILPEEGCFIELLKAPVADSKQAAIERIWRIGGANGWYGLDWAWKLKGMIDKLFHGPGMNRGRRHPTELEVEDTIDFWRVVAADKEQGRLILYAQMQLPGDAWLQFYFEGNTLNQKVVFRPKGVLGRLYWYLLLPIHTLIFRKMIKKVSRA